MSDGPRWWQPSLPARAGPVTSGRQIHRMRGFRCMYGSGVGVRRGILSHMMGIAILQHQPARADIDRAKRLNTDLA